MKKTNLYIAMLALAMSACTEEELTSQAQETYSLNAELVSNSKITIGEAAEGTHFSPILWDEGDSFWAFKTAQTIDKGMEFGLTAGQGTSNGVFGTANRFNQEDIPFAVLPYDAVETETASEKILVKATTEREFDNCHNAVMLGKYDVATKTMKFKQTMALLEMSFESLEGIDAIKIEADRNIAVGGKWGTEAILDINADGTGTVRLPETGELSNTIELKRGYSEPTSTTLYCALPVGNDYGYIKIWKGKKQKKETGWGYDWVYDETPLKTIKSKTEGGKITLEKKLYPVNCKVAVAPKAPVVTYMGGDMFSPQVMQAKLNRVTDPSIISEYGTAEIFEIDSNLAKSFNISPNITSEWIYMAFVGDDVVTNKCLREGNDVNVYFDNEDPEGIVLTKGQKLEVLIKDKETTLTKMVFIFKSDVTVNPDNKPVPAAEPSVTYMTGGPLGTEIVNVELTKTTDPGLIQDFGPNTYVIDKSLAESFFIAPNRAVAWFQQAFIGDNDVTKKCPKEEDKVSVRFSEEANGIQLKKGESLEVLIKDQASWTTEMAFIFK